MGLYLGNYKAKININGIAYCINSYFNMPIASGCRLLSLENYILKDANGLYLTTKESE